jgi:hypothetical protein
VTIHRAGPSFGPRLIPSSVFPVTLLGQLENSGPALRVSGSAFDEEASNRTDPQAAAARSTGLRAFVPGVPADLVEGLGQAVRPVALDVKVIKC